MLITVELYWDHGFWKAVCNLMPQFNIIAKQPHVLAAAMIEEINKIYGAEDAEIRIVLPTSVPVKEEREERDLMEPAFP